jgi:hypothetical protein
VNPQLRQVKHPSPNTRIDPHCGQPMPVLVADAAADAGTISTSACCAPFAEPRVAGADREGVRRDAAARPLVERVVGRVFASGGARKRDSSQRKM